MNGERDAFGKRLDFGVGLGVRALELAKDGGVNGVFGDLEGEEELGGWLVLDAAIESCWRSCLRMPLMLLRVSSV